jgi:Raf kinase inhibitor-like YbhB/YbcL family protein
MHLLIPFIMNSILITTLQVTSPVFKANSFIPAKYSCEGDSINPPIEIKNIPAKTKTLALVMDDPDAPTGTFDHWVMWNIAPQKMIAENTAPGIQGKNSKGRNAYTGPCPPSGTHHYHFKIYALDISLDLSKDAGKLQLENAMKGHIIAQGELIGLYKKS